MKTSRHSRTQWSKTESGIAIPSGAIANLERQSTDSYVDAKHQALEIERLFAAHGLSIHPDCSLARQIRETKKLSDAWLTGNDAETTVDRLLAALVIGRISSALLSLHDNAEAEFYLKKMQSGDLELLSRKISTAKDFLWELELCAKLQDLGFTSALKDPPDILVEFEGSVIAIPCKKVYSNKNTERVLSNAVRQVEASYDYGIAAINLDDLIPDKVILKMESHSDAADFLNDFNQKFLRTNERHFRKYLESSRLLAAYISTTVVADIEESSAGLSNFSQATIWTIPGLPKDKEIQIKRFFTQMMKTRFPEVIGER